MANAVTPAALQLQSGRGVGGQWGNLYVLWRLFTAEPVALTASVESVVSLSPVVLGFNLESFSRFGLWIKCTSATLPDIALRLLQSFDDVAADYAVPDMNGVIAGSIPDQNIHIYQIIPTPMSWMRLQLVGNAGNAADTTVTAYLMLQMHG